MSLRVMRVAEIAQQQGQELIEEPVFQFQIPMHGYRLGANGCLDFRGGTTEMEEAASSLDGSLHMLDEHPVV